MRQAQLSQDEVKRVAALRALNILDTPPEERFDRITRIAARLMGVPIAVIGLVDSKREWFKSSVGLPIAEVPRSSSFCTQTIVDDGVYIIPDALFDPRFSESELVKGEARVRFYAGCAISAPDGSKVGTLCVMDRLPRGMRDSELQAMEDLAAWVEHELKSLPDAGAAGAIGYFGGADVKAVFERLAEGIVAFNERGAIEWINPAAEFIFGYTSEQLAGQHIKRLMPVTFQNEITGHLTSRLLEGDESIIGMRTEAVGRRKDGSTMQLSLSISEVRLAEGRLFVSAVHNTSEQTELEEALRESEQLYRAVVSALDEGLSVLDALGNVQGVNAGAERILGVPAGQLMGRPYASHQWRATHEDGSPFPAEDHPCMVTLATGEGLSDVVMGLYMDDGSLRWLSINSRPVCRAGETRPYAVVSSLTDITERKAAQGELAKAQDRYAALCENVADFVSVHNLKGEYLFASPASTVLLGCAPDALIDTNVFSQIHPDDRRLVMDAHKRLAATDGHVSVRYRIKHNNGEYIWVETYSRVVAGLHTENAEILSVSRKVPGHTKHDMKASLLEDRKRAEDRRKIMEQLAHRDDLTSLMSRRAVDELLNSKLASRRASTYPFGCLLLDVDRFAEVNEAHGRAVGDALLTKLGQMLVECCRVEDYVARYGEDEFIIVLPNTDAGGVVLVADRIVHTIAMSNWPDLPVGEKITASVGAVCITRASDLELGELMEMLGEQLRHAKEMGRNRAVMNARETARHLAGM